MVYSFDDRLQTPHHHSLMILIKIRGHPNIVITFSNRKCVVFSALQSFTGVAFSHLIKYSVTIMIHLSPDLFAGGLIGSQKVYLPFFKYL
jgi:hypothetical protein